MGSYDEVGVSVPLVAEEHLHDQPDGSPDLPVHVEPVQLQLAADGSRGLEGSKGIRIAIQNLKTNVLFTLKTRGQNIALEHPFLSLDNYNIFSLFKEFLHAHVLLQDLGYGLFEVPLGHMDLSLPERVHAGLSADTLDLCPRAATHLLINLPEIDPSGQIHPPGVNLTDVQSGLLFRWRELNLPVNHPVRLSKAESRMLILLVPMITCKVTKNKQTPTKASPYLNIFRGFKFIQKA